MRAVGAAAARQLVGELEADRDADQHPQAGLLGEQRLHGSQALLAVGDGGHAGQLGTMSVAEPAALGQRLGEHALQPGRRVRDDLLGVGEALGVAERLDRGVDLGGGVDASGQGGLLS